MLCQPVKANPLFFFAPSRPQFSTSQYNHLRRAQHRHTHRQRLHRHSASAQRTPRRGDRVHQRPAALFHSEPHGCRHPPASLHRSTAIHRCDTEQPLLQFSGFTASRKCCIFTGQLLQGVSRAMIAFHSLTFDLRRGGYLGISQPSFLALLLSAAIYPATTLTPIGQTLPQPPQVIQQQQQREGEGERTLLLLRFTHLSLCNGCIKKMRGRLILH